MSKAIIWFAAMAYRNGKEPFRIFWTVLSY